MCDNVTECACVHPDSGVIFAASSSTEVGMGLSGNGPKWERVPSRRQLERRVRLPTASCELLARVSRMAHELSDGWGAAPWPSPSADVARVGPVPVQMWQEAA